MEKENYAEVLVLSADRQEAIAAVPYTVNLIRVREEFNTCQRPSDLPTLRYFIFREPAGIAQRAISRWRISKK
jgi:hypothetical protein